METLRKMWDNPIAKKALIILGVFFIIVIIIVLIASCSASKRYTPEEFETKLVTIAKKYYINNKSDLPKENGDYKTISIQTFVNEKLIKNLEEAITKGITCRGDVRVINNNGYYLYIPELDCGSDYKSTTLYDKLTSTKNIVTSGNGLYNENNEYIFKGETVNNYLLINEVVYRIIKINNDGTIRILDTTRKDNTSWDDRFNVDKDNYAGINDYISNNINSRLKDAIESSYKTDEEYTNDIKALFAAKAVCIGKRSINDNIKDSSIECSNTLDKQSFGALLVSDYFNACLDTNCTTYDSTSCTNYNYLTDIGSTWTLTADKDTTYKAYKISSNGVTLTNTSSSSSIRIVTNLNKEILYSGGNGTEKNPYVLKTFITK